MGKKTALIDKSKKGAEKNTLLYTVHCTIHTFDLSKNKTMNHTNLLSYSLRIIFAALNSISWFKTSGIK